MDRTSRVGTRFWRLRRKSLNTFCRHKTFSITSWSRPHGFPTSCSARADCDAVFYNSTLRMCTCRGSGSSKGRGLGGTAVSGTPGYAPQYPHQHGFPCQGTPPTSAVILEIHYQVSDINVRHTDNGAESTENISDHHGEASMIPSQYCLTPHTPSVATWCSSRAS